MSITFKVEYGNIISIKADAIVNSANASLRKGSGMCRSIYQKAGECHLDNYIISTYGESFKLNPGEAIITPGFALASKYIIHTVTPKYFTGVREENLEKLSYCYAAIVQLAAKYDIDTIAIPCLGVGHHGWPLHVSTSIAFDTLRWLSDRVNNDLNIIFCCHTKEQYSCYQYNTLKHNLNA